VRSASSLRMASASGVNDAEVVVPSDRGVRLENLHKRYDQVHAVRGVDITIDDGEIFALLGPSGSGKSTLMSLLTGLAQPDEGRVYIHGNDVTAAPPERRNVGVVFQSFALFPNMKVFDNVAFGLRQRRTPKSEIRDRVMGYLEAVGLSDKADRRPNQLSGGEQQRVAFVRALAASPHVLALDEPFGSLDVHLRGSLRELVRQLVKESNVPVLVITHDQDDAFDLADRVGIIRNGRIEQQGALSGVYERPRNRFVASFFGESNILPGEVLGAPKGREAMIRPENLEVTAPREGRLAGTLRSCRLARHVVRYQVESGGHEFLVIGLPSPDNSLAVGSEVGLTWRSRDVISLDPEAVPAQP